MAAVRMNIPAVVCSGGAMMPGLVDNEEVSLSKMFEAVGARKANMIDDAKLFEYETNTCPGCGSCAGMYTANSMNCLCEAVGIALPGNGTLPNVSSGRMQLAKHAGMAIMELVERDIKARDIINTRSIYNAVACDMALGCSSNSVLHLLAIANEAGVDLNMDIFNEISAKVPNLCHLAPAGSTHISDLNRAGGIPAVQAELAKNGLLDLDAILYPKTEEDRWENIGKEFAANLSTYWKLFSGFDGTTVSECDTRIRTFLNSRYEDDREDNAITLRTTGTDETAYYVLRTHNEDVRKVTGGTAEKLEDSAWLIRAEQSEVRITLGASDQRYYYEKGAKNE